MSDVFVVEQNLFGARGVHHLAANGTTVARPFYGLGNAKLSRSVDCRSGIGGLGVSHPVRCLGKTSRGAIGGLANRAIRKIPTPFSQLEIAASRKAR
jgi:hypothetical protein